MSSSDDTGNGAQLFSFGVITDTHIRAPQGDQSSPFPVNDLANDRACVAVNLLATQSTLFNVHLGDMVHPLPGMPAYDSACEEALDILKPLQPDLHFVPGNHDIGDKPMPGLPAAAVSAHTTQCYRKHFGDDYYCFIKNECLFVVLNSSLINNSTDDATAQQAWLEQTLAEKKVLRVFLFLHYPLFINSETESEHYDNIAEPGRSWLAALIKKHSIELVLSGHVHHHFYNRIEECKCYTLPPTSFTRQDYAEMFKVGPAGEYGRDDKAKYSVAVIEVFERGHRVRIIPTTGATGSFKQTTGSTGTNTSIVKPVTVHLRHAWYESNDLPYNGPMEEFSRKRARNDYVFLRLQQMGIRDVRVPVDDIIDPEGSQRVQDYVADGFRFHAFCPQHLLDDKLSLAGSNVSLISSLECVTAGPVESITEPDIQLRGVPLVIGYALTGAHQSNSGKPFAHSVSSGFQWSAHEQVLALIDSWRINPGAIVFQLPLELEVESTLKQMQSVFASTGYSGIANIRLANSNPAEANFDDQAILSRIESVMRCASSMPDVEIQLDTTMDIDRGYSPRNGLIDRLSNLRAAGQYLCNIARA